MISGNYSDNTQNISKEIVRERASSFSLSHPCTDEEFEDSIQAVGSMLLFGTRWDAEGGSIKKVPIVTDMPMLCKVRGCPFYELCDVMRALKDSPEEQDKLFDTLCRSDRLLGVQQFADLVRDLDIAPTQTVDLLGVANIVRWLIYRRRLDRQMALEGNMIGTPVILDRKTGELVYDRKAHPLLREAERVDKMIDNAMKGLVASRKDRMSLAKDIKKSKDVLRDLFTGGLFKDPDAQDAEFEELPADAENQEAAE